MSKHDESEAGTPIHADTLTHAPEPTNPAMPGALNPFARHVSASSVSYHSTPDVGQQIGRYINLGLIGRGGSGEVFRVRDPTLNRRLVLKVIRPDRLEDPGALSRFVDEAQLTS